MHFEFADALSRAFRIYKLQNGMIKQVGSWKLANSDSTRSFMGSRVNAFKIGGLFLLLVLTAYLCLFHAQTQNADQDSPNFDFGVYYTGNVRGNLEPCG
jgi:hypothetical protein